MPKAEYPALFEPGFHTVTIDELRAKCAAPFSKASRRHHLMANLEKAVQRITKAAFPADLWIDGSLLTSKIDPLDIDLALIVASHVYTGASASISETLDWIESDETYLQESLDGYVLTMFPETSALKVFWHDNRNRFQKLFGTKYDNLTPKGVAVIKFLGGAKCLA